MSSRNDRCPDCAKFGEPRADSEAVGDLAAEVVDEHGHRFVGEGLVEHLGGAQGGTGIADQRMRHGAVAARRAEPVRGHVVGVADEALGAFALRGVAADRCSVGHHVLHLGAGAVAGFHGQEGYVREGEAHLVGVVRGDGGRADLLQQDCFQVGQLYQAAADVGQRFAGTGPGAFLEHQVDVEAGAAGGCGGLQPLHHQAWGGDHRAAHEYRVGHVLVAEPRDDGTRAVEVAVGARRDVGGRGHRA